MDDRWLSVDEIAGYLGIKRDTVYKWIDEKRMPAHKVGRLWKFRRNEVDDWEPQPLTDADREMEFLYSLNQLQVAISRAGCVAVLVASPALFSVQRKTQLAMLFVGTSKWRRMDWGERVKDTKIGKG